jgi:hypothetical protein
MIPTRQMTQTLPKPGTTDWRAGSPTGRLGHPGGPVNYLARLRRPSNRRQVVSARAAGPDNGTPHRGAAGLTWVSVVNRTPSRGPPRRSAFPPSTRMVRRHQPPPSGRRSMRRFPRRLRVARSIIVLVAIRHLWPGASYQSSAGRRYGRDIRVSPEAMNSTTDTASSEKGAILGGSALDPVSMQVTTMPGDGRRSSTYSDGIVPPTCDNQT